MGTFLPGRVENHASKLPPGTPPLPLRELPPPTDMAQHEGRCSGTPVSFGMCEFHTFSGTFSLLNIDCTDLEDSFQCLASHHCLVCSGTSYLLDIISALLCAELSVSS